MTKTFVFDEEKLKNCQDWLLHFLEENGTVLVADLVEIAGVLGFGRRTLYRVAQELGNKVERVEGARVSWKLAA